MAQFTIFIPNAAVARVVSGICVYFQYQSVIVPPIGDPFTNPETQADFARRMIYEQLKGWVKTVEGKTATDSARTTSDAAVDSIGISVT